MSSANYLNAEKQYSAPTFVITEDPKELDDGARVIDSIRFIGNGTYPMNTEQTITGTEYTPLFLTGLSEEDYMRIKSEGTNTNYDQLAIVEYKLKILGNSMDTFNIRFATYDGSLNRVEAYDPILYDPSNNLNQSALLSSLNMRGFSVEYNKDAVYGFLEISGDGTGSIRCGFDYANSDLQNSIDTSRDTDAPTLLNLWRLDTDDLVRDASGVEQEIHQLEAEVGLLQAGQTALDTSVNALETDKVAIAGDVMTGGLTTGNKGGYGSGWRGSLRLGNTPSAWLLEGSDPSDNYRPSIGFYSSVGNGQRSIYLWSGDKCVNAYTPNWTNPTMSLGNGITLNAPTNMGDDLNMATHRIQNLPNTPTDPNDAVCKAWVDGETGGLQSSITANTNAIAGLLPKAGGTMTGALNMNGSRITNVPTPIQGGDGANKQYVDSKAGDGDLQSVLSRGNDADGQFAEGFAYITADDLNTTRDVNVGRNAIVNGDVNAGGANITGTFLAEQPLENIAYNEVAGNSTIAHNADSATNRIIYITSGGDCYFQLNGSYPTGYRVRVRNESNAGAPTIRFIDGSGASLFSGEGIGGQNATGQRWAELGYDGSKWRILCAGSDGFSAVR